MIWVPTLSAQNHIRFYGEAKPEIMEGEDLLWLTEGITIVDESGWIKEEVEDILKLILEADLILATGHLSTSEIMALGKRAKALGVRKIVVTHPDLELISIPLEDQVRLAEGGAYLEKCLLNHDASMVQHKSSRDGGKHQGHWCRPMCNDDRFWSTPPPQTGRGHEVLHPDDAGMRC